jgi:prepilin-type N-terminal cleavage/methylation domain-containing protein
MLFKNKQKNNFANKLRGFTLIELLVSVSLFVMILTLALGSTFSAQTLNARLLAHQAVLDSMNYSFEIMSRQIRYGSIFYCDTGVSPFPSSSVIYRKSCPYDLGNGGTVLIFKPVDAEGVDDRVGFYLDNKKIYQWSYIGGSQETKQITEDNVSVDTLQFFVTGANTTQGAVDGGNTENSDATVDTLQPIITVIITGDTVIKQKVGEKIKFQLETTITPRGMDN